MIKPNLTKFNSGTTLMELLIVLAIISLLMSIVGPMTMNLNNRTVIKSEILKLKALLRKQSSNSYFKGENNIVILTGSSLVVLSDDKQIQNEYQFEKIYFSKQEYSINMYGFIYPVMLEIKYEDKVINIDVGDELNILEKYNGAKLN